MGAPDLFVLLKKVWHKHGFSSTVNLSTLTLGAQDADTGWYAKSYTNSSIEMYVIPMALRFMNMAQGLFIEYDANGYTKADVKEGDIISLTNDIRFLNNNVVPRTSAYDYLIDKINDSGGA